MMALVDNTHPHRPLSNYKNFQWSTLTSGTLALTPTEKELANGKLKLNYFKEFWYLIL